MDGCDLQDRFNNEAGSLTRSRSSATPLHSLKKNPQYYSYAPFLLVTRLATPTLALLSRTPTTLLITLCSLCFPRGSLSLRVLFSFSVRRPRIRTLGEENKGENPESPNPKIVGTSL